MTAGLFGLLLSLGSLSGCTEVRIYHADRVSVRHYIGIVDVDVSSETAPSYVETTGSGVVIGARSVVIGWMQEHLAVFPDPRQCAVMIVAQSPEDVRAVDTLLRRAEGSLANVCVAGRPEDATRIQ